MLYVISIGVSAWMVYETIRAVTSVHPALQPLLMAAICYGLTWAPPVVLTVLCASAVAALFRMLMSVTATPQMVTGLGKKPPRRQRIPDLPPR
jgi:hypothetical protein